MRYPAPGVPGTAAELVVLVDYLTLSPQATADDVADAAREAGDLGCASICVSPARLPVKTAVPVCAVIGFPSGAHSAEVKSAEAAYAALGGASEFEMVVDLGLVKAGAWTDVEDEIALVRGGAGAALLKVVIESAALTDDEIVQVCEAAGRGGANYVVTSTGFQSAGGATEHAVRLMREVVGDELGVKASGRIRTAAEALSLIAAGASRVGSSEVAKLLRTFEAPSALMFAATPEPPYTAVIFTSTHSADIAGYFETTARMEELAAQQPGYLGIESARETAGFGITVSYWATAADARAWKSVAEHAAAQKTGRTRWYADYRVRIATVQRSYGLH